MDLTQPFVDLAHTSRALLGVNLSYVLEGLTYFGVVGLLAIFFNDFIGLDDIDAGRMVGILTAGITICDAISWCNSRLDWSKKIFTHRFKLNASWQNIPNNFT